MAFYKQRGGVSLFIVIFTTLIVTIIAVSFTQVMIRNQQQITASDLSQRAYNSALAGVEDAKRVLIANEKCKSSGGSNCPNIQSAIDNKKCNTIQQANLTNDPNAPEVMVGDKSDNQAYTCVKIISNTESYTGNLDKDQSQIIHLKSSATEKFSKIKLYWFTNEDAGNKVPTPRVSNSLPKESDWTPTTPPIMRAQFIPGNVDISNLDNDARTLFLYPTAISADVDTTASFDIENRTQDQGQGKPNIAPKCFAKSTRQGGVCMVTIDLPKIQNSSETADAYLQLAALYNKAHFTIELLKDDGSTTVDFNGVQPIVDSTGRADSLFRRVKANVELKPISLPFPDAELNVKNNICKDFALKDQYNDYDPGKCNPSAATN